MDSLNDFHFLRPLWFLAILPLLWLCYHLWRKRLNNTGLEGIIHKQLLSHLVEAQDKSHSSFPFISLLLIWSLTVIALAGPTWKQIPQALASPESAVVILLDLSPSMRAEDLKPSRIIRAHLKIQDLLSQRKEGLTALVVYAGEAHIVTPLTDDAKTISNLLPTLKPGILPLPGSNTEMGITVAADLVRAANIPKASILLITDNIDRDAIPEIKKRLPNFISLTILGLGTDEGAPIPNNGDFIKDKSGNIIIAKRNSQVMQDLAKKVGGYYLPIQSNTADIDFYFKQLETLFNANLDTKEDDKKYDTWYEFGPILLLLMTPFVLLIFRRGLIIGLCSVSITVGGFTPSPAQASVWDYLWKNDDQRAIKKFQGENYGEAAKTFDDAQWKGHAYYKNGDYEAALGEYSKDNTAIGDYNKGNALAQLQRYDDAIAAYNQALEKNPQLEQAEINKKILKDLKEQKQKQEQDKDQNNDKSSDEESEKDGSEKKQEKQNKQKSGNKENEKQQDEQPQNSEQQSTKDKEGQENKDEQEQQDKSQDKDKEEGVATAKNSEKALSPEKQQALEQWLRKVPDDPSGLLKRKFEYEYQLRRQLYQKGEWKLPENNAHQRY